MHIFVVSLFKNALKKAAPNKIPKSSIPLDIIKEVYKVEADFAGKAPEKILAARREKSEPLMNQLHQWCAQQKDRILPKSLLGKAVNYTLEQWNAQLVFLSNPLVPVDNNVTERAIRPFVIGRKNWLFSDTASGAHASACFYSLIETTKACETQPYDDLTHLFKELPKAKSVADMEILLPYNLPDDVKIPSYKPKG